MEEKEKNQKLLKLPDLLSGLMNLTRDQSMLPGHQDGGFDAALKSWAEAEMKPGDLERFLAECGREALLKRFQAEKKAWTFEYVPGESEHVIRRFSVLPMGEALEEDILCVCCLYEVEPETDAAQGEKSEPVPFGEMLASMTGSYHALCRVELEGDQLTKVSVEHDRISFFPIWDEFPASYDAWVSLCASSKLEERWRKPYIQNFSQARIGEALDKGETLISWMFESGTDVMRQDSFLLKEDTKISILVGVIRYEAGKNELALITASSAEEITARRIADLEIESAFERKELKKRYRWRTVLLVLLALSVGVTGGPLLNHYQDFYTPIVRWVFGGEEEETAAPEEEKAEEAVVEYDRVYVSRSGSAEFTAEIFENGTPRTSATDADYDSMEITAKVTAVYKPSDFDRYAATYLLDGTEAGVEFSVQVKAVAGKTLNVVPQDAFYIYMIGDDESRTEEYQLMDKLIAGSYQVSVKDGGTKKYYKRYSYLDTIYYMVLAYYQEGVRHELWFALGYDDPNVEHATLKLRSRGEEVRAMKQKLSDKGYFTGKVTDYFDDETRKAVIAAQEAFGLEGTGIADQEFLQKLYSRSTAEKVSEESEAAEEAASGETETSEETAAPETSGESSVSFEGRTRQRARVA